MGEDSSLLRGPEHKSRRKCLMLTLIFCIVLLILIVMSIYFYRHSNKEPLRVSVETRLGKIRGRSTLSPQHLPVWEFLGIPFAKPPVGNLRFSDPEPLLALPRDPYDALSYETSCIQSPDETFTDFHGSEMWNPPNLLSEDCLYLNIWIPMTREDDEDGGNGTLKHVLVWIYGGGFMTGSNALEVYSGKALAAHTEMLVVNFNYRVGSLGFFSTGDGYIKGNFGLKDQVLALRWIKDNIHAFGGDPDHVTLIGESAGAASVGFHLLSEQSTEFFERAVMFSGSPDAHWAFLNSDIAKETSRKFINRLNCSKSDDILSCLRNVSVGDILDKQALDVAHILEFPWAPTVDGQFLTDEPSVLLSKGKVQEKDAMLVVNKDEGAPWVVYGTPGFTKDRDSLLNYTLFKEAVDFIEWDLDDVTRDRIVSEYTPVNTSDEANNRDVVISITGDRSFLCPTLGFADSLVNIGITPYFSYLTYRASNEDWPAWMGVVHGADIQWLFGMPLNKSLGYTDEEAEFSQTIMSYLRYFSLNGNPNGDELPHWPAYQSERNQQTNISVYLEWAGPSSFMAISTLNHTHCPFWKTI